MDLFSLFSFLLFAFVVVDGQFDANMTLQSIRGYLPSHNMSIIQCTSSIADVSSINIKRTLDTGQGRRPPRKSQQFIQDTRRLWMPPEADLKRFGAYHCSIVMNGIETKITTLKLPPEERSDFLAVEPYKVVNKGDSVVLEMENINKIDNAPSIKWRHDGDEVPAWENQLVIHIPNVDVTDAGIYECYYEGRREQGVHGLMRLIVRTCSPEKYGKACENDCPACKNGGICQDLLGVCICPAGFIGPHCETACGPNHFGSDCRRSCSEADAADASTDTTNGCSGHLFCKPDPFGCSCAPGFEGPTCTEVCKPGFYGAECKQPCNCSDEFTSCNRFTGHCEDPSDVLHDKLDVAIDIGEESSCPPGKFNLPTCEKSCHCLHGDACNPKSGHCPEGCAPDWNGDTCSECIQGRFGEQCENECHCLGGPAKCAKEDGFCESGCEAGWTGYTCQQSCVAGKFGPNCGFICHCKDGPQACNKTNGVCAGDCEPGFMGETCQKPCPETHYGMNCVHLCTCKNGGRCRMTDGVCQCKGKWRGVICDESVPHILSAPDEDVNKGQFVIVSCTADGIPKPNITISTNEPILRKRTVALSNNQLQALFTIHPSRVGSIDLECFVQNEHGNESKIFSVLVIMPPKLRDPPRVLEVMATSVKVDWNSWEFGQDIGGKESDRVDYLPLYRKQNTSIWRHNSTWRSEPYTTFENLEPDTLYEFAVKCRRPNPGGEGDPSPAISAKTYCDVPSPNGIAQDFSVKEINSTSVTLTWKAPPKSELHCSVTGYKLRYTKVTDPQAQHYAVSFMYKEMSRNDEAVTVTHLSPSATYELHLFVRTLIGLGDRFAKLEVTTLEGGSVFFDTNLKIEVTVPGHVKALHCEPKSRKSMKLYVTWEEPEIKNGKITGYAIAYKQMSNFACNSNSDASVNSILNNDLSNDTYLFTQETQMSLDALPFSSYVVAVRARTSVGLGDPEAVIVDTPAAAPAAAPQKVQTTFIGKRELHFTWDTVDCQVANGEISGFEYELRMTKKTSSSRVVRSTEEVTVPLTFTKDMYAEINNLVPFMEYGFTVRARSNAGVGPFSEVLKQRTVEDVPPPAVLSCLNVTESEVCLQWNVPTPSHGIIEKYMLQCFPLDMPESVSTAEVDVLDDEQIRFEFVFDNLKPSTWYTFQIRGKTKVGWGNWSEELIVETRESLPGPPVDLHLISRTDTSLEVGWRPPLQPSAVSQYKISCADVTNGSNACHEDIILENDTLHFVLENLLPSSNYNIQVRAATKAGFGPPASSEFQTEDGEDISMTPPLSVSGQMESTLIVSFTPLNSSSIRKYQIIVEEASNSEGIREDKLVDYRSAQNMSLQYYITAEFDAKMLRWGHAHHFIVGNGHNLSGYYNAPLKSNTLYNIRLRLVATDGHGVKSAISSPVEYKAEPEEIRIWGMYWLYFMLLLIMTLIIVMCVTAYILFLVDRRRRRSKRNNDIYMTVSSGASEMVNWSVAYIVPDKGVSDGTLLCSSGRPVSILEPEVLSTCRKTQRQTSSSYIVLVDDLADYVETKLVHPVHNFLEEFQKLPSGQLSEWTAAKKAENVKKNRYGNALPYDNNRVVIKPSLGVTSDYINASYIKGYNMTKEYIATQGPMENTVNEFWQMVWQENSSVIVMVTGLLENGKRKCAKYWPDDSSVFGDISILLIYTEPFVDFILRTFLLKRLSTGETRRVLHYQYLDWPNGPAPFNTSSLLHMQQRIRMQSLNNHGPYVVHCSAGVGRAGTFIAVDTVRQQAEETRKVDIFGNVRELRLQRNGMVQTLEQYTFIYETILEATQCGNTAVSTDEFPAYLRELCRLKSGTDRSKLEHQFMTLGKMKKAHDATFCSEALHETNILKNRDPMIVPTDTARLRLKNYRTASEQDVQSDYINAVSVNGYRQRTVFLVTHMPLEETVIDFWQMIYTYNSSLIIMLDSVIPPIENTSNSFGQYWPEGGCCLYGPYEVQVVQFEDQGELRFRIMKLFNNLLPDEEPHRVIQIQFMGWPEGKMLPESSASVLNLLNSMDQWYRRTKGGPITVHCWDGATRSGLFCAACYITDQLKCEHMVDVFHAVKRIRSNREEFVPNVEQYKFCYEIASELMESLSKYSTFRWSSY